MLDRARRHIAAFTFTTRLLLLFMLISLCVFALLFTRAGNGEFLFYSLVTAVVFLIIISYYSRLRLTEPLLVGIALHWLLSFMGGTLYLGTTRLYDLWLLPWLKYDNVVHAFGVLLLTFVAYNLLRPRFRPRNATALFHFSLLLFLVVMGLGAVAEIFELLAVLFLDAGATVGDYFNNAYDLCWNAGGALLACLFIARHERRGWK